MFSSVIFISSFKTFFPSLVRVFLISVAVYNTLREYAKLIFSPARLTAKFDNITAAMTSYVNTLRFFSENAKFNERRVNVNLCRQCEYFVWSLQKSHTLPYCNRL